MLVALLRKICGINPGSLRRSAEPVLLDHVPVEAGGPLAGWEPSGKTRVEKLFDARTRYGRAFKCAGPDQDREVMVVAGIVRTVRAGRSAPPQAVVVAELTAIPEGVARLDERRRR